MAGGFSELCTIKSRLTTQSLNYEAGVTGGSARFDDMIFDEAIFDASYVSPGCTGTPVVGQTVTGGISLETATITRVTAGYIVVKNLTGEFEVGETITSTTFSCVLGTQTVFKNEAGEPEYYWYPLQVDVPCHIYTTRNDPNIILSPGEVEAGVMKIQLPPEAAITKFDKIISAVVGFAGTFGIIGGIFVFQSPSGIDHYEATLKLEASP